MTCFGNVSFLVQFGSVVPYSSGCLDCVLLNSVLLSGIENA